MDSTVHLANLLTLIAAIESVLVWWCELREDVLRLTVANRVNSLLKRQLNTVIITILPMCECLLIIWNSFFSNCTWMWMKLVLINVCAGCFRKASFLYFIGIVSQVQWLFKTCLFRTTRILLPAFSRSSHVKNFTLDKTVPSMTIQHRVTLHYMEFSWDFYPKRLTITAFNQEYKQRTTRIKKGTFLQENQTTEIP